MATPSTHRDPRSIVTPDAFEVSETLLGLPLASPPRRLAALVIDLAVIGLITLMTRSFGILLGVVAAGFFMRAGFKRTPVRGSVFGRAMRRSVGCLGLLIALVTAVVWTSCGSDRRDASDEDSDAPSAFAGAGAAGSIVRALAGAGAQSALEGAATIEEAEATALDLARVARELGMADGELRDFLVGAVPPEAPWADGADAMISRVLDTGPEATPLGVSEAVEAEVAAYSDGEALAALRELLEAGGAGEDDAARRRLLARRLAPLVAGDTLAALEDRVAGLEQATRTQRRELERAGEELAEATSGGVFGWLREFVDELGFGFGWASLYLTVFLSWWKGQTVGKRMMGIRVVRLDGEPITWWTAFERAGGYAAGFATGLLGFAQVFWDANRQAIHDRIVGTVVVMDKAERVSDWESAL